MPAEKNRVPVSSNFETKYRKILFSYKYMYTSSVLIIIPYDHRSCKDQIVPLVIIFFAHGLSDVSFLLVNMFSKKTYCHERILSVWRKECMEPIPELWKTMLALGYPNMKNMEPFHP